MYLRCMTFAGALLLTFNVAILLAIPLFGDNPYARDQVPRSARHARRARSEARVREATSARVKLVFSA